MVGEIAFPPEVTFIICDAYDKACRSLQDGGQPAVVREVIARRIIELARDGERDPDVLSRRALLAITR